MTAVVAAIPGPPDFTKLYVLALTDLPLHLFVSIGASIYFLLSVVPVGIGGAVVEYEAKECGSGHPTKLKNFSKKRQNYFV